MPFLVELLCCFSSLIILITPAGLFAVWININFLIASVPESLRGQYLVHYFSFCMLNHWVQSQVLVGLMAMTMAKDFSLLFLFSFPFHYFSDITSLISPWSECEIPTSKVLSLLEMPITIYMLTVHAWQRILFYITHSFTVSHYSNTVITISCRILFLNIKKELSWLQNQLNIIFYYYLLQYFYLLSIYFSCLVFYLIKLMSIFSLYIFVNIYSHVVNQSAFVI